MATQTFIATFGGGQKHADCFCRVTAASEAQAEAVMTFHHGTQWCMLYPSEEAAGVQKFGLRHLKTYGGTEVEPSATPTP